jgi:protein TonB
MSARVDGFPLTPVAWPAALRPWPGARAMSVAAALALHGLAIAVILGLNPSHPPIIEPAPIAVSILEAADAAAPSATPAQENAWPTPTPSVPTPPTPRTDLPVQSTTATPANEMPTRSTASAPAASDAAVQRAATPRPEPAPPAAALVPPAPAAEAAHPAPSVPAPKSAAPAPAPAASPALPPPVAARPDESSVQPQAQPDARELPKAPDTSTSTSAVAPDTATRLAAPQPSAAPASPRPAALVPPRFDADYLANPPPVYPALSRRNQEEGRVILRVLVDPDGRPLSVETKTSSGWPRLDRAAEDAVRLWRFVPGREGDRTVQAHVLVPLSFSLED